MESFCVIYSVLILALFCNSCHCCKRNGAECPEYTVLQTFEKYEERLYPSLVWVSTSEIGQSKSDVSVELITRLYGYLGGHNDKGMNLNMMVPVRTRKVASNSENSTYTMSLALTPDHQIEPPVPRNPSVTMIIEPETVYVTRSFGGMIREETEWETQASILRNAVRNDAAVNSTFYYMSVYDSPWREKNRLNEVWMIKTSE